MSSLSAFPIRRTAALVVALVLLLPSWPEAHEIPADVTGQGFVKPDGDRLFANGGRVLNVSARGKSIGQAQARAYAADAQPNHMLLGIFVANDLLPNAISYADSQNHLTYDTARINLLHRELETHLAPLMPSMALRAWAYHTWVPRLRFQFSVEERFIQPTYALIDKFTALAQSLGARASVVIIYPRYSVSGGLMGLWSSSEKTGALLAEHCRTKHIPVLDLLDHIQGAEDAERYYYAQDGHFNGAGNERVASAIYQELIAR